MTASDETLMVAYQAGDVPSFDELLARYERPVWVFVRRLVHDEALAEDLLQEVFLRVVGAAGDWKPEFKVSGWIFTIARNLCADNARRAVNRRALSLEGPAVGLTSDDSAPLLMDGVSSKTAGAERQALDRELRDHIDRAVDALPLEQREVFLMRELMDLPFPTIAQSVGASETTVKSRMRYALDKLREDLSLFYEMSAARTGAATSPSKVTDV